MVVEEDQEGASARLVNVITWHDLRSKQAVSLSQRVCQVFQGDDMEACEASPNACGTGHSARASIQACVPKMALALASLAPTKEAIKSLVLVLFILDLATLYKALEVSEKLHK